MTTSNVIGVSAELEADTLVFGTNTLGLDYDISGTGGIDSFEDTGLEITIPKAGRWKISVVGIGRINNGADDGRGFATVITDSLDTIVSDGGRNIIASGSDGLVANSTVDWQESFYQEAYVTVTTATTYKLRAAQRTNTPGHIVDASTTIRYEQLPQKTTVNAEDLQPETLQYVSVNTSSTGVSLVAEGAIANAPDLSDSDLLVNDPFGLISFANDNVVISSAGRYEINYQMASTVTNTSGVNYTLYRNGTEVLGVSLKNTSDGGDDLAGPISWVGDLNVGDTIHCETSDGTGFYYVSFTVKQLPSSSVVLADAITPTTLAEAKFYLAADSVASLICPLDTAQRNTDSSKIALQPDGSVIVQPGRWVINASATRSNALMYAEIYDVTNNVRLASMASETDVAEAMPMTTVTLTLNAPTTIQLRETNAETAIVWDGSDITDPTINSPFGSWMEFVEVASQSVVLADTITPTNLAAINLYSVNGTSPTVVVNEIDFTSANFSPSINTGDFTIATTDITFDKAGRYEIEYQGFYTTGTLVNLLLNGATITSRDSGTSGSMSIAFVADIAAGTALSISGNNGNVVTRPSLTIREVAAQTVTAISDIPLQDMRVTEHDAAAGFAGYTLSGGRTWQDLINDYEFVEVNWTLDVTGVADIVLIQHRVATDDLANNFRLRSEYGIAIAEIVTSSLASGAFTVTGSTLDAIPRLHIQGVRNQRTVISEDTVAVTGVGLDRQVLRSNGDGTATFETMFLQNSVASTIPATATAQTRHILVLAAGGTMDAPTSPSTGDRFAVTDGGSNFSTNNVTVNFGSAGSPVNLHGAADDMLINTDKAYIEFEYVNASVGWISINKGL